MTIFTQQDAAVSIVAADQRTIPGVGHHDKPVDGVWFATIEYGDGGRSENVQCGAHLYSTEGWEEIEAACKAVAASV